MIKWPYTNYSNPRRLGVNFPSHNFYLESDSHIRIGLWHVLPKSFNNTNLPSSEYESILSESNRPIVVYFHGNTWTRSAPHRVQLYNLLAAQDYHVIAVDYRGYADSTGAPSEEGVIHDALFTYQWVKKRSGNNRVFVWAHSLGTAIGTAAVKEACNQGIAPDGLVLEAPFNNLSEIARHHALTKPFRWLPFFEDLMVQPFNRLGLYFETDKRIRDVQCPILLLHARDDKVIPFKLGEELKDVAVQSGRKISFVFFHESHGYGHKYICRSPKLSDIFREFVDNCCSGFAGKFQNRIA